jgi:hypothetical protein
MLGVYSKAATCVRQTMCTVTDRAIPSSQLFPLTLLPTCHLRCMSNKLIFLISSCLLDLERFSYGRGRSRSLIPCPAASMSTMSGIILGVYSKAVACIRQSVYTADRNIPPSHLLACTTLPAFMLAACLLFLYIYATGSRRRTHGSNTRQCRLTICR